jgi:hypothetical protein
MSAVSVGAAIVVRTWESQAQGERPQSVGTFYAHVTDRATDRILERRKATLEAEIERLRREYRIALIVYERQQLGRRDAA